MHPWNERLTALCDELRLEVRRGQAAAGTGRVERPVGRGVGDVTYDVDARCERVIDRWLREQARQGPLSLLTEDAGWRHLGPGGRESGGAAGAGEPLPVGGADPFDHGGPRIAVDPVDGTRNLMADLRSGWTVVGLADAGRGQPRLSDLTFGLVSELPDSRAGRFRVLRARTGRTCELEFRDAGDGGLLSTRRLEVDGDDRPDHGYFPFVRFAPDLRPAIAAVEAEFFRLLSEHEGADTRQCFDDQYICGGGQTVLLALGTYRSVVDVRGFAARLAGRETMTGKPYDVAGALVCARAAGCVFTDEQGHELDFPIDCQTAVDLIGWTNARTARRLWPHLRSALERLRPRMATERA